MLNNRDPTVREMDCASLIQHLGKRKIQFAKDNDKQWGLKSRATGNWTTEQRDLGLGRTGLTLTTYAIKMDYDLSE